MPNLGLVPNPSLPVATPVLDFPADGVPGWVEKRGADARGWDRRQGELILGPKHTLWTPGDLVLTNGILRAEVGPRGLRPFLRVSRFRGGVWREMFYLTLSEGNDAKLSQAYIEAVIPEAITVVLTLHQQGEVLVTLARGEPFLRVLHGRPGPYAPSVSRYIGLEGVPPSRAKAGTVEPGGFGNGLRNASGTMVLTIPPDAARLPITVALRWVPDVASSTHVDAGLAAVQDWTGADIGQLRYFASDRTIRWVAGGFTLSSAPVAFAVDEAVPVILDLGPAGADILTTTSGTASGVLPSATPSFFSVGQAGLTTVGAGFGEGGLGEGGFGGTGTGTAVPAGGLIDNVMIFSRNLTGPERAELLGASRALGGLPSPESDLALYVPFDVNPILFGSVMGTGVVYETDVDNGGLGDVVIDANGLMKALLTLDATAVKGSGLSMRRHSSPSWEVAASVATTNTYDTITDHLAQYAATNYQETWVK